MTRSLTSYRRLLALPAVAALAVAVVAAQPASADGYDVVASGLDNPRGLTVADTGDIFVAEAGTGGNGPCFPNPEGGADTCFGASGAVTRISGSHQSRVVTGLPSIAANGESAIGAADVVATGGQKLAITLGLGMDPAVRDASVAGVRSMGTLLETHWRNGSRSTLADIAAHELATNPIHDADSNPVGLIRQGSTYVVADAGGNTVVRATKHGATSTLAVLPDQDAVAPDFLGLPPGSTIPAQAVPTSVAVGPDGAYYVSQLTGFPFEQGLSKIYRLAPDGTLSVYASGLTNVTDLAFAPDGTLYAVEISEAGLLAGPIGALVRVAAGSDQHQVVAGDLFAPYGLALSGGSAYVTTGSVAPGAGQVIRVPLG
jgi:hypothetical protein